MKQLFRILLLFFLFNSIGLAQKKILSKEEKQQDLAYLNKYLSRWHPTYYNYTNKVLMDAYYQKIGENDSGQTAFQFKATIRRAISKIGCGHINVEMPRGFIPIDSGLFLPIDINLIGNRIFVRNYFGKDSLLQIGDEILAINGLKSDSLINNLAELISADGYNISHKKYLLEKTLFGYYYQVFGAKEQFIIEKRSKSGEQLIKTIKTPYRSATYYNYFRNPIDSSKIIIKGKGINLQKVAFDSATLVIDFNSVSGKKQRKTYKEIFRYIAENKTQNLIIDLRDNGGGNVFKGHNFLKYLLKKPIFGVNLWRIPRPIMLNPINKASIIERTAPLFFTLNPIQYSSQEGWNHFFFFAKKHKYHFDKKLFVITNGMTFSMASIIAARLRDELGATIIGEESGGSEYASRGMASAKIKLPNSKLKVNFNIYQMKYGKEPDSGHGISPSYKIDYTFADRSAKVDKELLKIKELIKN